MKPIIMEADEMTECAEIYSSKPAPFSILFIYFVLSLVIIAVVWMSFSEIDIVVKAQGSITTQENLSTVTNQVDGTISNIYITDGQEVKQGDPLYSLDGEELKRQLSDYESSKTGISDRIIMLNAYLAWLNGEESALDGLEDNPYYSEINARKELVEINNEAVTESAEDEKSQYSVSLNNTGESISYYEEELSQLEQLLTGIKNRENPFAEEEVYYYSTLETYISEYTATETQYENQIETLQQNSSAALAEKSELKEQKKKLNATLTKYKESLEEAQDAYTQAKKAFKQFSETSVNEADSAESDETATAAENQSTQLEQDMETESQLIDQYTAQIKEVKEQITEVENQITSIKTSTESIESQITSYEQEKATALYNLEMETISSVEQQKKTLEESLTALQSDASEAENNMNQISGDTDISKIKSDEINAIYTEITTYEEKQEEVEFNIKSLEESMENTTLYAAKDGAVNMLVQIEEGDYVAAGTELFTIIPQDSGSYMVELYVNNKDIGRLKEGMGVKYDISAFPTSEYGNITGELQTLSKDIKGRDESGTAYYQAIATVNKDTFLNEKGESASLKVGMACESRVIIGKESVLRYLLEKIDLLD